MYGGTSTQWGAPLQLHLRGLHAGIWDLGAGHCGNIYTSAVGKGYQSELWLPAARPNCTTCSAGSLQKYPRPSQACSFHFQQPGQGQAGSDESAQRGYRKVWAALSACPADDAELSGRVSLCSTAPLTQGFRPWAGSGRPGPVNGGRGRIPTRAGKGRGALLLSKQPPVPGGRRLCRASL